MNIWIGGVGALSVVLLGCSVRSQAPIRMVAYDFSDHAFYDRSYAPSPDYGTSFDARRPEIVPEGGAEAEQAPAEPADPPRDGAREIPARRRPSVGSRTVAPR